MNEVMHLEVFVNCKIPDMCIVQLAKTSRLQQPELSVDNLRMQCIICAISHLAMSLTYSFEPL